MDEVLIVGVVNMWKNRLNLNKSGICGGKQIISKANYGLRKKRF